MYLRLLVSWALVSDTTGYESSFTKKAPTFSKLDDFPHIALLAGKTIAGMITSSSDLLRVFRDGPLLWRR
tara:strand:- start:6 stop:215 length:210 start_codon:yes stop_codon:yes gene_type:complete